MALYHCHWQCIYTLTLLYFLCHEVFHNLLYYSTIRYVALYHCHWQCIYTLTLLYFSCHEVFHNLLYYSTVRYVALYHCHWQCIYTLTLLYFPCHEVFHNILYYSTIRFVALHFFISLSLTMYTLWLYSLHASPLAQSPGQVKLDSDLWVKIMNEFVWINREFL